MTHTKIACFCLLLMLSTHAHAKIVFINRAPETWNARDVYVMDDDGSNMQNLTPTPQRESSPAWSPDGRKIAFTRALSENLDGQNRHLFLMDADGRNQRHLTEKQGNEFDAFYPIFLPGDNKNLTFLSNFKGQDALFVINLETGIIRKLFDGDINAPDW